MVEPRYNDVSFWKSDIVIDIAIERLGLVHHGDLESHKASCF